MTINRVRYREGQILHTDDLLTEQQYRIAMRRRHLLAHHGWGIVKGLAVVVSAMGVELTAGIAVDGYGRELVVPHPVIFSWAEVLKAGQGELDLWLLYERMAVTVQGAARWQEDTVLWLTPAQALDRRFPPGVTVGDWNLLRTQHAPDDPKQQWPVYLGSIDRSSLAPPMDHRERPYVELTGQTITAPSGSAQMQLDSELAGRRDRFVIRILDDSQTLTDRLMIDYQGNLTVQGNATMEGNVTLARAPDQDPFVPHLGFEVMKPPPVDAAPWQFYYTVAPVEPPAAAPAQPPPAVHQLRFEILDPDEQGEPTRHQFAIGAGDPHFAPFLTVRADGTVVMVGDVEVTGQVVEGPIQPDLTDPRFGSLLAESWVQGQGAGVSLSDVFNATQLTVQIDLDKTFSSTSIYQIRLTNSGSFDITNLKVYEVLTTNGQAYPVQEMSNEKLKALAPNTTVAIAVTSVATRRQLKLSQKTPFTLTVTAIGFGPGFLPQATASKQIEIDPTIEEPTP